MNRMILPVVLAICLMPLAFADAYRTANTPGMTGSPAAVMATSAEPVAYRAPPLYMPNPMGVARDVRFLPPVSQDQLQLDEQGVVTTGEGNPVTYGTSGGVFDSGHNSWVLRQARTAGPYFSSNQQGFKAGMVQTSHYQKWRGRSYLTDYLGYKAPLQVLKQWGSGIAANRYNKPGIPNMIVAQPQYVNPGLPGQVTPS